MTNIDVLIVEDKDFHIEEWKEAIEQFNLVAKMEKKHLSISAQFSKSYEDAKIKLRTFNFSTAIIDIRLEEKDDESNENNTEGNDVLLDIVKSTMCLAWVYTGQQTDASIPLYLEEYIEIIDRSKKSKTEMLELLESKLDTLSSIIEIKNRFSQSKASHFYSSIWPRWSLWLKDETSSNTNKAIIRHMATHLHASFLNETERVHPEEYYFTGPMIDGILDTGDITLVEGKHFILVTPRCEIAQDKNRFYQFVELEDKSEEMRIKNTELASLKKDIKHKKADIKEKKKALRELKQNLNQATKNKNSQKTLVNQTLSKKNKAEEPELMKLNLQIVCDVETLFKLELVEKTAQSSVYDKELEVANAESELQSLEKQSQKINNAIKALLPSNGGKISLHILPEVKQLDSDTYGPLHAHFEKITYIDKKEQETVKKYEEGKYARLSNEFIPSFVERLGSHFSRIGTPDYSHPE